MVFCNVIQIDFDMKKTVVSYPRQPAVIRLYIGLCISNVIFILTLSNVKYDINLLNARFKPYLHDTSREIGIS